MASAPNRIHVAVVVLFGLASFCYLSQWFDAAVGLGILGFLLEIAAWTTWIATDEAQKKAQRTLQPSPTTREGE